MFLGYHHKGYRCLDLATNRIILSRHVNFDESSFPFAEIPAPLPSSNLDFLSEFDYVYSPFPSPFVAGSGVAGSGVTGPGVMGAGPSPAAQHFPAGGLELSAPLLRQELEPRPVQRPRSVLGLLAPVLCLLVLLLAPLRSHQEPVLSLLVALRPLPAPFFHEELFRSRRLPMIMLW